MPEFLRRCYSEGTFANREVFQEHLRKISDGTKINSALHQRDHMDKTALMMCAISGNLFNTKLLIESGQNFATVSKYGESALYFAMKYGRWQYLKDLRKWYESLDMPVRIF
jgi:ankyrin repeat protein